MNIKPLAWSPTLAALMTTLMLSGPAPAATASEALTPSVQFHDPDGQALLVHVKMKRPAQDSKLYPVVFGAKTDLSGRIEFAPGKMTISLDKPLVKGPEEVTIVYDREGGEGHDSTPDGAAAYYEEPVAEGDVRRTLAIKTWLAGTHTMLAVWGRDKGDESWTLYVTFRSATNFATLANSTFSATGGQVKTGKLKDSMGVSKAWKLSSGTWYPMQSAIAEGTGPGDDGDGDEFVVSDAVAKMAGDVTIVQTGTAPTMELPSIREVLATTDQKSVWVDWKEDRKAGPQASYRVDLLKGNRIVATKEDVAPHMRRAQFDDLGSVGNLTGLTARVTVANLLDVEGTPVNAEVVGAPVFKHVHLHRDVSDVHALKIHSLASKSGDSVDIGYSDDPRPRLWDVRPQARPGIVELRSAASGRCVQLKRLTMVEAECNGSQRQQYFLAYNQPWGSFFMPYRAAEQYLHILKANADGTPTDQSVVAFNNAVEREDICFGSKASGEAELGVCSFPKARVLWRMD